MRLEQHRRIEVRWYCGTVALEHAEATSGVVERRLHDTHFQVIADQRKLYAATLTDAQESPYFYRYGQSALAADRHGFYGALRACLVGIDTRDHFFEGQRKARFKSKRCVARALLRPKVL